MVQQVLRRLFGTSGERAKMEWTFPAAIAEIDRLGTTLKPGWDGHGAAMITFDSRTNALDFVRRVWKDYGDFVAPPVVAPVSDGGIALEWPVKVPAGQQQLEIVFVGVGNEYSVRIRGKSGAVLEGEDESVPFLLSLVNRYGR